MSYCRFAWDNSDVYVFGNAEGYIECCGCKLSDSREFQCKRAADMIVHLQEHRKAGHCVPQYALDRSQEEAAEAATKRAKRAKRATKKPPPERRCNARCCFCGYKNRLLWRIADPNLDLSRDIDWSSATPWWYVCEKCRTFMRETQKRDVLAQVKKR